jgi:predicted transposase YbfD/YdcC
MPDPVQQRSAGGGCYMMAVIRTLWVTENSLHWVMDMTFRDDECHVRTDHAPASSTTINRIAQNLLRTAAGKDSLLGRAFTRFP